MSEDETVARPIRLKCRFEGQTRLVVLPTQPSSLDYQTLQKQLCSDYGFEVGESECLNELTSSNDADMLL